MTSPRYCSRPTCGRRAIATLEFDYAQKKATIGPLAPEGEEHRGDDLCAHHAERTSVPYGWDLHTVDYRSTIIDEWLEDPKPEPEPSIGRHPSRRNLPTQRPVRHLRMISNRSSNS